MNEQQLARISRFMSLVLRHKPEEIKMKLDKNGWANVKELINGMKQKGYHVNLDILKIVVGTNNKQRFSFNNDFTKIRANQGHSIDVDIDFKIVPPPEFLYHGTATHFLEQIKKDGLVHKKRQYVHLSIDVETAINVGKRHGNPVVLKIKSGDMQRNGIAFYLSENGVWLLKQVPTNYIAFDELMFK